MGTTSRFQATDFEMAAYREKIFVFRREASQTALISPSTLSAPFRDTPQLFQKPPRIIMISEPADERANRFTFSG